MRRIIPTIVACLLISNAGLAAPMGEGDVTVEYLEPENFTDFKTRQVANEKDRRALEAEFRKKIAEVAVRYLPPGYKLHLRFRDINMAGDFEPQLGPDFNDVRIVKSIYPPSILVDYEVTNEAGEVVASGSRRVTDLAFQNTVSFRNDERLFYESELVRDLIREIMRGI